MSAEVSFRPNDRILVLAPHPDDEIIGCAGIIQKALGLGLPLHIVFFTYGDNNEWSFLLYRHHPVVLPKAVKAMGLVRHDEAYAADRELGNSGKNLSFLGYPDFRTLAIWCSHWDDAPAATSMLTRVNAVPYQSAVRPGALYKGEEAVRDLKAILRKFSPTKIFLSHAGDHNPDHVALYLFTHVALWELQDEVRAQMNPQIYPYLVHHKHWPLPRGFHPDESLEAPESFKQEISWKTSSLSSIELIRKENAVKKYRSQYEYSSNYLLSFVRSNELFGDFPSIVLKQNTGAFPLSPNRKKFLRDALGELADRERALFIGLEEHYMCLEEDQLIVDLEFFRPLGKTVGVSLYLFGYRNDCPFMKMPKIHIRFGAVEHRVYDQGQRVSEKNIRFIRRARGVTIHVPVKFLGNPRRFFTNVRTYMGDVPLDCVPWRVVTSSDNGYR